MKKRILIVLLAMALALLPACVKKDDDKGTSKETQSQVEYLDDLAPTDQYDGVEFRALAGNPSAESNFLMADPGAEATLLQSASYKCVLGLDERFGISVRYKFMDSYSAGHKAFLQEITSTTMGGAETAYDMVVPGYWYGLTIAKGSYINLNTLSNLDFSKPYWNQAFNENVEINDYLYACVGDFSLDSITGAYATVFNQKIINDQGMTSPFTHYDNNTWTLDTMLQMAKDASNDDIAGSETYGVLLSRQPIDAFYTSSGLRFYTVNDGDFVLTKYSDTAENLYQKLYQVTKNKEVCKFSSVSEKAELLELFVQDRALFGFFALDEMKSLRNMQSDYGVIVYPKYDKTQAEYITGTTGGGIFAVPKSARDPEMSALVMEAMSAAFYQNVRPALIEVTLEGQSVRDARSSSMISEIIESIYWDFGFINHTSLKNVAEFGKKMEDGYETMSGWYYGVETQYEDALIEYLNGFLTGE